MESLKFDDGFKELAINGDKKRVIKFNPSDITILDKIRDMGNEATEMAKTLKAEEDYKKYEKMLLGHFDKMLGEGSSVKIFNGVSPIATSGGRFLYEIFLEDALLPYINKHLESEYKKNAENIKKYTGEILNDR